MRRTHPCRKRKDGPPGKAMATPRAFGVSSFLLIGDGSFDAAVGDEPHYGDEDVEGD
jgi:hypothetical protein